MLTMISGEATTDWCLIHYDNHTIDVISFRDYTELLVKIWGSSVVNHYCGTYKCEFLATFTRSNYQPDTLCIIMALQKCHNKTLRDNQIRQGAYAEKA